jgi:hypothetical protein
VSITRIDASLLSTIGASEGDVLTYVSANSSVEFVATNSSDANLVNANLDSFASYSNSTFATDTNLNTVQSNLSSLITSNTTAITVVNANLVPSGNVEYALGSPDHLWSDLWLSGSSLHLGNVHIFETADGSGFHMTSPHSDHTLTLDIASGNTSERFGNVEHAITSANTNINTVQSNLSTLESTVTSLGTEVDTLGSYANSTFATDTNLNTVSANVDGVSFGLSGANTNINVIAGNLDAYATYANATFSGGGGGGSGDADLVQGNLSAFATYANTTFSGSGGGNTVTATSTSTGDGATVNYTLPSTASNAHNILVTVDGLLQRPVSDYTVNTTTLTFASAPPTGTEVDIRQLSETGVVSIQAYASNSQILTSNVHSITVKTANLLPTLGSTYDLGSETYNWNNIHASNIISPSAGYYWVEAASNTTMSAGKAYFVDCSSQTITMTLPSSPSMGNSVRVIDATGSSETNNITIARNSSNIMGQADDITVNQNRAAFMLVYYNTAQGWLLSEV